MEILFLQLGDELEHGTIGSKKGVGRDKIHLLSLPVAAGHTPALGAIKPKNVSKEPREVLVEVLAEKQTGL